MVRGETSSRSASSPAVTWPRACNSSRISSSQLTLPTPCPEYDVRALLSHIVGGLTRAAIIGEGGDALARPARADDVPDDGKIPGRFALAGYLQEILTHGWDLAQATGQPTEGAPDLAVFALAGAKRVLPPSPGEGRSPSVPSSRSRPTPLPTPS
jgi:hypothetical protein